jgi:hypothetical protein
MSTTLPNDVNLDTYGKFYIVNHGGKTFQCDRVTNVIEATKPTNEYLIRWMVNCAVEATVGFVNLPIEDVKKIGWDAHKLLSKQALEDGSQVHEAIDLGVGDKPISDAARACLKGYQEFVAEFIPVKITGELKVYDTANLIAGTIDYLALSGKDKAKKKTLWILDWKSSKQINRDYKVQIVVYKWMLQNFLKAYLKNPTHYSIQVQRVMDSIVAACGKKPKINCMIVRLNKKLKARILHEKCLITAKEERSFLAEFKLMLKLHQIRKGQE